MSIKPLKIGSLTLKNNIVLAPMAGITNSPYRQICVQSGVALVYSEMVSSNGLIRAGKRTQELLTRSSTERPFGVQLFGDDPEVLGQATEIASELGELIDLNMGCPVKKVIRSGAGSALLCDPAKVARIVATMRRATTLPFTVKIRSGWNLKQINFLEIAHICELEGADAVILHPRTRCQGFGGHSNWDHLAMLKQHIGIPVIGSGDIYTAQDGLDMLNRTGCDGIMIGRGGYGNPWLIDNILRLQQGQPEQHPTPQQRLATA